MNNIINFSEFSGQTFEPEPQALAPAKKGRPRTTDREKIASLRQQGYTQAKIAEALGCSVSSVKKVYRELDGRAKALLTEQDTQTIATYLLPEMQDDSYRPWNQPFFGLLEERVAPASTPLKILFEKDKTGHFINLDKYPKYNHYGIYGLYKNDQLVYVGSTCRPFKDRIITHYQGIQQAIETGKTDTFVYSLFSQEDKISVSILIDMYEVGCNQLTERDLRAMELAMITYFAPVGNVMGIKQGFRF